MQVKKITVDFEAALWKACRSVLPCVKLQGCVFHWTQALWRKVNSGKRDAGTIKGQGRGQIIGNLYNFISFISIFDILPLQIQQLGLQTAYGEDDSIYKYLRKLMALPFLPHAEIRPMFMSLSGRAQNPPLSDLVTYIQKQWIDSETFPPANWSIYQQAIRTNNDLEGWHNALNRRAGGRSNLPFYHMVEILEKEARLTAVNIRLVSEPFRIMGDYKK